MPHPPPIPAPRLQRLAPWKPRVAAGLLAVQAVAGMGAAPAALSPNTDASSAAPSPTFLIERFDLAEPSPITSSEVHAALSDILHRPISLLQLRRALHRLQEALRHRGFRDAAVTLPRQRLNDGVARLLITASQPADPRPTPAPPTYDVQHWIVRGNSALSAEELDQLIGTPAGAPLTLPQLESLLRRLRDAYRDRGYPSASVVVPHQILTDGTVVLQVTEGAHLDPRALATTPTPPTTPESQPDPTFEVRHYQVLGNTLLPDDLVASAFTNALGTNVTFARIQDALGSLQLAYRTRGYATVAVGLPQQQLTNATVTVQVTEGRLVDIQIVGNRHFSESNIRRALPSLRTHQPLQSLVFQRELDLANQNRDRQIYPTLGPGPDPGTSALTLRVKDRLPLHGRLEINNLSTPGTPEWRINTSAQYNNLWQREHQAGLSYAFSPEAFKSGAAQPNLLIDAPLIANYGAYYRFPLGAPTPLADLITASSRFGFDEATRQFRVPPGGSQPDLTLYASGSTSDTGIQFGPATTVSQTPLLTIVSQDTGQNLSDNYAAGSRLSLPFPLSERQRLTLSAGFDFRSFRLASFNTNNFIITTVVTNAQGSQTIESRVASPQPPRRHQVDYLPLSLGVDFSQSDSQGATSLGLALAWNVLGPSSDFAPVAYSPDARRDFGRATLQFLREQNLPQQWSLQFRGSGQLATGPLIANEQFSVGGSSSVRGYDEGEDFGDLGWFLSTELRTPYLQGRVPAFSQPASVFLRGIAFVDLAQRFLLDAPDGLDTSAMLGGAGLGISASLDQRLDLRLSVGIPFFETRNTPVGSPRAYLTFGGQY